MSEPSAPVRALWHSGFDSKKIGGWMSIIFWSTLIGVTILLLISGYSAFTGANRVNLHYALLGGLSGFGATALGAIVAIVLRDITARTQDTMLGFAAGMMLAASSFSLILPVSGFPNYRTPRNPSTCWYFSRKIFWRWIFWLKVQHKKTAIKI